MKHTCPHAHTHTHTHTHTCVNFLALSDHRKGLETMTNPVAVAFIVPKLWFWNTIIHQNKSGFYGEMTDSRSESGSILDEPENFCHII